MSALVDAARAELAALDERRRILILLLDAYAEPGQDVPAAASNGPQPPPETPAPAARPAPNGTGMRAAKAAIVQHLQAGPQSPRMLRSLTQLSDSRFRSALAELVGEQRLEASGSTKDKRYALAAGEPGGEPAA